MHRSLTSLLLLCAIVPAPASAQEGGPDCAALYAELSAAHPVDLATCEPSTPVYSLNECTPPSSFSGGPVTTHLILAIDASGSMAAQVGGASRMEVAKREARAFLGDVHKDIAVGLMVYGHRGTNQPEGKAESCAATEMVHGFDASRSALGDTIAALRPTGWTPLAGVLAHAGEVVDALPPGKEGAAAVPVVYLISDGEETCEGDPVEAARALLGAGVPTTVNTIGFAVDAETAAQLEAIAEAGGGTYYPAKDARALQDQLNAIRDAEISLANYAYCVDHNAGLIGVAYHNAKIEMTGCYGRNNPTDRMSAALNAMNQAKRDGTPAAACAAEVTALAMADYRKHSSWLNDRAGPLNDEALRLVNAYYLASGLRDRPENE